MICEESEVVVLPLLVYIEGPVGCLLLYFLQALYPSFLFPSSLSLLIFGLVLFSLRFTHVFLSTRLVLTHFSHSLTYATLRSVPTSRARYSKCATKSSNATLFANAFTSNTPSTPAQRMVSADTVFRKRPSLLAMLAPDTLLMLPPLRRIRVAGRIPGIPVRRGRAGRCRRRCSE